MDIGTESRSRIGWVLGTAVILLGLAFVLVWGLNMRRGLNHDEHQFIAGAALIARDGLLPYRDFPYFHVPTLSFVYALLFQATDYLLLAARAFSILCSWLTLVLIFVTALRRLPHLPMWQRVGAGAAAVLLLMTTPSFLHASGRAWNHDFPILLTLLAAVGQTAWLKQTRPRERSLGWLVVAGVLVGMAAGVRLTFALAGAAFVFSILLVLPWRERRAWLGIGLFGLGAVVGALPALIMLWIAPQQFVFGNLTYAQLNTAYYQQAAETGAVSNVAMTLGAKLAQTLEYVITQPSNLLLVLLAGYAVWRVRRQLRQAPDLLFLLLLLVCFLAGAYAPTPLQQQYIYLLFPLLALIFLAALARDQRPRPAIRLAAAAALLSVLLAVPQYAEGAQVAFIPTEWFPLKVHARGEYAANLAQQRRVLTLAPIYPLEGKASIYPELVTGPMGRRVAPFLAQAEREEMGLVGLDELTADAQPRAILVGLHDNDAAEEAPLLAYAEAHGYVPIPLPEEGVLWIQPLAAWGDQIKLGAADLPVKPTPPGSEVMATLYLQSVQPIASNLNVLVRLVGAGGQELTRDEGWPWGRETSTWPVGEVWPDGHLLEIPEEAAPGPYRVEVSFYDPNTLQLLGDAATAGYIVIGEAAGEQPVQPAARFGDGITLVQADVPVEGWQVGAEQTVTLTWLAEMPERGRYTVFLHLVGPDGAPVAQGDQEPWRGAYPTDAWLTGVPAADEYHLTLPENLPAGAYSLFVGLYDPVTQQRLPLLQDGQTVGDSYLLTTVEVE